ncbi:MULTISPECIES: GPW/gp25 family protein [Geobacter]|uniref:GPW/gp25 family protein n=1 Tax=Geobacter TaxID=28231 RepID=UPI0025722601|nr:GPW/gp25 family protein [Geobacter sulfurreducens]BEH11011.1 GPW/gp25 family protein [Geobacter sulfurreducens subsp. ethanolicus]BET58855.1 GPW/gp25 family protein [Geobacter sp. 60473]
MTKAREFLGTGWTFPVAAGADGCMILSSAEGDIAESIRIILGTARGERVMRPDFGCGIHDRVFSVINTTTLGLIENEVKEALILWEPRIELLSVTASPREAAEGRLLIDIEYRVRSTNTRFNLVYPFYLKESA